MSFLACYNTLHERMLGVRINYNKQNKYLSYLIKIYKSIQQNKKDYKAIIDTAKKIFLTVPVEKRNTYKLQDTMRLAIIKQNESEKEERKNNIPSGVHTLMNIIAKISSGENAKEAYSAYRIQHK